MAINDTEIEVKSLVSKNDFLRIMKLLLKKAEFKSKTYQKDTYYSPAGRKFLRLRYPYEWLSVRERDAKVKLNYKHWYPENAKLSTYCDEYETEVGNKDRFEKILTALQFEKLVCVEKKRTTFVFEGLEIALDEVCELGYFIEIESLDNNGGVSVTRKRILDFAENVLGIDTIINVPGGYAAELMRKKGLMK